MGVQIKGEFYSDNGGNWEVYIYNSGYASTVTDVIVHDLNITWESQGDDLLEPLKASRAAFSFINNSGAVDSLISGIKNGDEDQFHMVIEKESNLYWAGVVLIDQLSWEDKPKPRIVTITAIDGIGRLADIEFDFATDAANPAQTSMLGYIFEALEYNGLSQYWGASDAYFKESCEFYETQMPTTGGTFDTNQSPLLNTRCDRFLFITDEVAGEKVVQRALRTITIPSYRPVMCSEVLSSILQLFSCRMMMVDGSYQIQQVRNFTSGSHKVRSISKSLSIVSHGSPNNRQTEGSEVQRLGDGRWSYKPALQLVRLDSVPKSVVAQEGGEIEDITYAGSPIIKQTELGRLKGGSGSGKSMTIIIETAADTPWNLPMNATLDIEINFQAGSYRLKSAAATPDKIEWTTTATDRVIRSIPATDYFKFGSSWNTVTLEVQTPEFPWADQSGCELDVEYTLSTTSGGFSSDYVRLYPVTVVLLQDGTLVQETQFQVQNPKITAGSEPKILSYVKDYGKPILNDITPELSSKNTLEVYDGVSWDFAGSWDAGYSSDVSLIETLCLETMSFQRFAVDILQCTIKLPTDMVAGSNKEVKPHYSYYYDSQEYVFNGGAMNCNRDELNGEWVQVNHSTSGVSIGQEDGDGWVYRGDDKIGLPKKQANDKDKFNRALMMTLINKKLATIDADYDVSSGAITSISIDSLDRDIYEDDIIEIVHPVTLRSMDSFFLSANATSGDTSISVVSQTPAEDLPAGCLVMFDFQKTIESGGLIRGTDIVTLETTVPTSGGFGIGNVIRNPGDGHLYYSDGTDTYKITGTTVS
jgi:hypothetical protein